jgi:TPR repeat protein
MLTAHPGRMWRRLTGSALAAFARLLLAGCAAGGRPTEIRKEILERAAAAEARADDAPALAEYRQLAGGGVADAMLRLAEMYDEGRGVRADPEEATRWSARAARTGDPRGMRALGDRYRNGVGAERDLAVAARWYEQAFAARYRDRLDDAARARIDRRLADHLAESRSPLAADRSGT